ncbi:MAG: twin-arginine translocase TatA/TatE family subunit [Actinomycetota bacterium]|nr:twin-arginine translocase TatA/TatE family subunit [Actinomycetota bacterium]
MIDHLGLGRLFVLGVVSLLVFGPERLPELASQAGKGLRSLRRTLTGMSAELREAAGPELSDLSALDPRAMLRDALSEPPLSAQDMTKAREEQVAGLPVGTPALALLTSEDSTPPLPPEWSVWDELRADSA